jgi:hypothetical protein
MPRKRLSPWRIGERNISPQAVSQSLAKFPQFTQLNPRQQAQLAEDLACAAGFASIGFPVDRIDASGIRNIGSIFMADVARALTRQGLPVATSRCYEAGGSVREALVFMIAREVALLVRVTHASGRRSALPIQSDPYRLLKSAQRLQYSS